MASNGRYEKSELKAIAAIEEFLEEDFEPDLHKKARVGADLLKYLAMRDKAGIQREALRMAAGRMIFEDRDELKKYVEKALPSVASLSGQG